MSKNNIAELIGKQLISIILHADTLFVTLSEEPVDRLMDVKKPQRLMLICENPWRFVKSTGEILGIEDIYRITEIRDEGGEIVSIENERVFDTVASTYWQVEKSGEFDLAHFRMLVESVEENTVGDLTIVFNRKQKLQIFVCGSSGIEWQLVGGADSTPI